MSCRTQESFGSLTGSRGRGMVWKLGSRDEVPGAKNSNGNLEFGQFQASNAKLSVFRKRIAKVRVSSFEFKNSSFEYKNGRIRCFLLIQLKLKTRVLILETRYSIEHNTRLETFEGHCPSGIFCRSLHVHNVKLSVAQKNSNNT